MAARDPTTYLVETYVPKLDEATAVDLSARLRGAIAELRGEGLELRWLRSFALVGEETYVWMLTATNVHDITRVNRRAGVTFDHIAEVVPGERPARDR
jgi:hypothetical protein